MTDIGAIRAKIELDTKQYLEGVEKAKQSTAKLGDQANTTEKDIKRLGLAFTALTATLTALTAASIKTAAAFEQSMSRVQALTGATAEEFEKLREQSILLGSTSAYTASQVAEAQGFLAMAGFKTTQILESLDGVLRLATAGQMDLARASDITSNILTGFQLSAEETGRVVDVMAKAMTNANTNIEQLGYAFRYVGPVASSVGLSIEETAAAISALADAGLQGEMGGTQLRAMLLRLISPTGEAAKIIEKLGINVQTSNGQLKSLPDIIDNVSRAFDGLSDAQRAEYASTLVGMEATSGFLTLLSTGADELRTFTRELENAAGAAEEIANIQKDNLSGAIMELKSALEAVNITVGDNFIPLIRSLAEHLTKLALQFDGLDKPTQNAILAFTGMATVGGTVTTAIYGLVAALNVLKVSLRTFGMASAIIAGVSLALGGLAAAIANIKTRQDEATEAARQNEERIKQLTVEYDRLAEALKIYEEGSDEAVRTSERMKAIMGELSEKAPDVVEAFNKQEGAIKSMTAATSDAIKENIKLLQSQLAVLEADTRGVEEIGASGVAERSADIMNIRRQIDELKGQFWSRADESIADDWRQMQEIAEEKKRIAEMPSVADDSANVGGRASSTRSSSGKSEAEKQAEVIKRARDQMYKASFSYLYKKQTYRGMSS